MNSVNEEVTKNIIQTFIDRSHGGRIRASAPEEMMAELAAVGQFPTKRMIEERLKGVRKGLFPTAAEQEGLTYPYMTPEAIDILEEYSSLNPKGYSTQAAARLTRVLVKKKSHDPGSEHFSKGTRTSANTPRQFCLAPRTRQLRSQMRPYKHRSKVHVPHQFRLAPRARHLRSQLCLYKDRSKIHVPHHFHPAPNEGYLRRLRSRFRLPSH